MFHTHKRTLQQNSGGPEGPGADRSDHGRPERTMWDAGDHAPRDVGPPDPVLRVSRAQDDIAAAMLRCVVAAETYRVTGLLPQWARETG